MKKKQNSKILFQIPSEDEIKYSLVSNGTEGSKFFNSKLPMESEKNNKHFHPAIVNSSYLKMLKLHTLPILNNPKAYKEKCMFFRKKLAINSNEKRKYSEILKDLQGFNTDKTRSSNFELSELKYSDKTKYGKCKLVVEVIKGWSLTKSKLKPSTIPVVEIQKLPEVEFGKSSSFFTDNKKITIVKDTVMWSQIFEINYSENVSDVYKKFKISLFQPSKGNQSIHIGNSFTISMLTNLDNQEVTFKTFDFSNGSDTHW